MCVPLVAARRPVPAPWTAANLERNTHCWWIATVSRWCSERSRRIVVITANSCRRSCHSRRCEAVPADHARFPPRCMPTRASTPKPRERCSVGWESNHTSGTAVRSTVGTSVEFVRWSNVRSVGSKDCDEYESATIARKRQSMPGPLSPPPSSVCKSSRQQSHNPNNLTGHGFLLASNGPTRRLFCWSHRETANRPSCFVLQFRSRTRLVVTSTRRRRTSFAGGVVGVLRRAASLAGTAGCF